MLTDSIYRHSSSGYNGDRDYFNYNNLGLLTLRESYRINENSEWEINRRHTLIYNEDGLLIEYLFQHTHYISNEFENLRYHYFTYNDDNLMTEHLVRQQRNLYKR